jgi:hypothetical protein
MTDEELKQVNERSRAYAKQWMDDIRQCGGKNPFRVEYDSATCPDGIAPARAEGECSDWGPHGNETTEANARLISSAPDLLEACRGLVGLYGYLFPEGRVDIISGVDPIGVARAAIAKATGTT